MCLQGHPDPTREKENNLVQAFIQNWNGGDLHPQAPQLF